MYLYYNERKQTPSTLKRQHCGEIIQAFLTASILLKYTFMESK